MPKNGQFGVQLAMKRSAQFVGHGLDAYKIQCDQDQFSDISFALSYKNLQNMGFFRILKATPVHTFATVNNCGFWTIVYSIQLMTALSTKL